jgi:hypothetical protein
VRGAAVVVAGAGVLAARRVVTIARSRGRRPSSDDGGAPRWHAVTVFKDRDEIAPDGRLPGPLAELGDAVEVRLEDAPNGRGTEIHVRAATSDGDGRQRTRQIRVALRTSKQLLETGEVLKPDRPGSTRPTLLNAPLRYATAHGLEEGRL